MSRVLGVVRLSRESEASLSISDQRARVESWAAAAGHNIVGWAEDDGVSGAVALWQRPGSAEWFPSTIGDRKATKAQRSVALAASRANEWDGLAFAHVDRLGRRLADALEVIDWCRETGRKAWDLSSGVDMADPSGPGTLILSVLGGLAQAERERMSARARASRRRLSEAGRYGGGALPLGYRNERGSDGHPHLVLDPVYSLLVQDIARRVVAGASLNKIVSELNRDGVKTPTGKVWRVGSLHKALTSERMLGYEVREDKDRAEAVVRDSLGEPIQRADAVLSAATLHELRAVLRERGRTGDVRRRGHASGDARAQSIVQGVLFCGVCLARAAAEGGEREWVPMYRMTGGRGVVYYRCASKSVGGTSCGNQAVRQEETDKAVVDELLGRWGTRELTERTWREGAGDVEARRADLTARLDRMRQMFEAGAYDDDQATALSRMAELREQRAALEGEDFTPSGWVEVPTGRTAADRWVTAADDAERNAVLRSTGARFLVLPSERRGQEARARLAVVWGTFEQFLADPEHERVAAALSTLTQP